MGKRSPLVIMKRDPEAPKKGFTNWSYIEALHDGLLPIWPHEDGLFQQDNARIHTANKVKEWQQERGIKVLTWPSHSPDLNPIEHVWKAMKDWLKKQYPELHLLKQNEHNLRLLHGALIEAWNSVPQQKIDLLITSIERRLLAVIAAKGWYTHY